MAQKTTIIDASGLVLGRMATAVAKKALEGETVHIIHAEKAIISGSSKKAIQARYRFKREVGTARKGPYFPREPHLIVKRTVRGMLPYQKPSGRAALKRIKAYIGVPKELVGQQAESLEGADRDIRDFMTVAQLATSLGRPTEPWQMPEGYDAPAPTVIDSEEEE